VWVSDIDGRSGKYLLPRNGHSRLAAETVSAFTGRIRYVCDSEAEAADFHRLIAFAVFAGIGSHTTYGFGAIEIECAQLPFAEW
jgi:CRISPR/Cas system endoribonuclease Cas6 (RAMP superfamily)